MANKPTAIPSVVTGVAPVRGVSARFDRAARRVVVELTGQFAIDIPLWALPHIADASDEQLEGVEVVGAGNILYWESLDADYSIPALVMMLLGPDEAAKAFAKKGGQAKTDRKSAAARENGRRGGDHASRVAPSRRKSTCGA
jgi:hypothetical protein